jgi:hypothetical protein
MIKGSRMRWVVQATGSGGDETWVQNFGCKAWRKETIRKTQALMDLKETGWEEVDWFDLAQDRDRWAGFCEHGNELSESHWKARNFLNTRAIPAS